MIYFHEIVTIYTEKNVKQADGVGNRFDNYPYNRHTYFSALVPPRIFVFKSILQKWKKNENL